MSVHEHFPTGLRHRYFVQQVREGIRASDFESLHLPVKHLIRTVIRDLQRRMEDPGALGGMAPVNAAFEAIMDAVKKYWMPDLIAYKQLAIEDNRQLMRDFRGLMTIGPTNHFLDGTLATHFNWADRIFNAHISPKGGKGLDNQRIYISGGVTRALNDLAFRAFCNQGFFSWEIDSDEQLWSGCSCFGR